MFKYGKAKERLSRPVSTKEFQEISEYLQYNKIKCFKYNYSLDSEKSETQSFQSYLQYNPENDSLVIVNRRLVQDLQFVVQTNLAEVNKLVRDSH